MNCINYRLTRENPTTVLLEIDHPTNGWQKVFRGNDHETHIASACMQEGIHATGACSVSQSPEFQWNC